MDKQFTLLVRVGSVINRPNGQKQTLTEVPANALELWEEGTATLMLKKDAADVIADFSKDRLEKILNLRRNLNYKSEIKLLETAVKNAGKPKNIPEQE